MRIIIEVDEHGGAAVQPAPSGGTTPIDAGGPPAELLALYGVPAEPAGPVDGGSAPAEGAPH